MKTRCIFNSAGKFLLSLNFYEFRFLGLLQVRNIAHRFLQTSVLILDSISVSQDLNTSPLIQTIFLNSYLVKCTLQSVFINEWTLATRLLAVSVNKRSNSR